ncbi:hypothetical protein Mag101_03610 [Microbulbifer agarilyticus]|uniref:Zinc resistance-associated protein n=1 Tax=Microbulbifer agarilyticus TaxID=260552 RepID=A0A1Q2M2Q6_9GAMM|nr:hypothetical protein [Microbulbifer agarilyticus]AQQ66828.1 hypothetical protein Mag101_03610 [Microbulbifer agarilyticus]
MPRKSHHPFLSSLCAALVALLLFALVSTGEATDKTSPPDEATDYVPPTDVESSDFWEKYDDIADWTTLRLKLTPQQEEKVLPILEKSFELQLSILQDYGIGEGKIPTLTREQRETLDAKIIAARAATRVEMIKLLNEEQLEVLKQIQQEFHQEFRKQLDKNTSG